MHIQKRRIGRCKVQVQEKTYIVISSRGGMIEISKSAVSNSDRLKECFRILNLMRYKGNGLDLEGEVFFTVLEMKEIMKLGKQIKK